MNLQSLVGFRGVTLIVMAFVAGTILIWGGKFGDAATCVGVFMALIQLVANYLGQRKAGESGNGEAPANGKAGPTT